MKALRHTEQQFDGAKYERNPPLWQELFLRTHAPFGTNCLRHMRC